VGNDVWSYSSTHHIKMTIYSYHHYFNHANDKRKEYVTYIIAEEKNEADKIFREKFPYVDMKNVSSKQFYGRVIDTDITLS